MRFLKLSVKILVIFILLYGPSACQKSNETRQFEGAMKFISSKISSGASPDRAEVKYGFVVLPGNSCGSCISRTLYYISQDITCMDNLYVIFTNHSGLKGYRLTNDLRIFDHENFIDDRSSELQEFTGELVTPIIGYFDEGRTYSSRITVSNVDFELPNFLEDLCK